MIRKSVAILLLLLCAGVGVRAQRSGITDTGWQSMRTDSVRPWCAFGVSLDGNWQDSSYSAGISYPELLRIKASELKRWNLATDDIPEWPDVESTIGVSHGDATLDAGFMPIMKRDGRYYAIVSYKPVIKSALSAAGSTLRSASPQERYTHSS